MIFAELIIYATLDSAPNVIQSFYWQTGMLKYLPSPILLSIYVGFIAYSLKRIGRHSVALPWLVVISAGFTFMAGGFSETYVALQTGMLLLAVVICLIGVPTAAKRIALPLLIAGLIGSVLALVVVVIAPGNQVRQSHVGSPTNNAYSLIALSLLYTFQFIKESLLRSPLTVMVSFLFPLLFSFQWHSWPLVLNYKKIFWLFGLSCVVGYLLVMFCVAPSVYAIASPLVPRAGVIPQFLLICFMVGWGYFAGLLLKQSLPLSWKKASPCWTIFASAFLIVFLVVGPVASTKRTFSLAPMAKMYASIWDERDAGIKSAKAQGHMNLAVPALPPIGGIEDLGSDPNYWLNNCVAKYYGIYSIVAQ
ncbi:MAG: hypothetical protein JW953_24360 [Anaerolineae bacterium]|nr:hypothetical protein [Anaerolineae bacterium]